MTEQDVHNFTEGIYPTFAKCIQVMHEERLSFEQCLAVGVGLSGFLLNKALIDQSPGEGEKEVCQVLADTLLEAGPMVISGVLAIIAMEMPRKIGAVRASRELDEVFGDVLRGRP